MVLYLLNMTLFLYDCETLAYIGTLYTAWIKENISPQTIIIFEKIKYFVVHSEKQSDNIYSCSVKKI